MKFIAVLLLALIPPLATAQQVPLAEAPSVAAKAWLIGDFQSGQILAGKDIDERVEPASLTKMMTTYVAFNALRAKHLSMDQVIPVSEKAWKAEGSRMFIEPNKPVTVEELMHGIIVQSGNDACTALAEFVGGSEDGFAALMNKEAQRLGMKNSHFVNSTGLPDPQQYTTPRDLFILAAAMIRDHPDYYPLWALKEYRYNNISQPNRNRLLWSDPYVDGIKTGHTETAGYCLVASAKRGERRLVSVVMNTASDRVRAAESQKLLNYGFQSFDTVRVYQKGQPVWSVAVWKGKQDQLRLGVPQDLYLTLPKGQTDRIKAELVSPSPLYAPVSAGQPVGRVKLSVDGKGLGEYPVTALDTVPTASIFGRAWDSLRLMLN